MNTDIQMRYINSTGEFMHHYQHPSDIFISYDNHDCDSGPSSPSFRSSISPTRHWVSLENTDSPAESDNSNPMQPFKGETPKSSDDNAFQRNVARVGKVRRVGRVSTKQPQSRRKNIPGSLLVMIFNGLRYCFKLKTKAIDIPCVSPRFVELKVEKRRDLKEFMESQNHKKTWSGIRMKARRYGQAVDILRELVVALLSDENKRDLELGLIHTRMNEELKDVIREDRNLLREAANRYLVL